MDATGKISYIPEFPHILLLIDALRITLCTRVVLLVLRYTIPDKFNRRNLGRFIVFHVLPAPDTY